MVRVTGGPPMAGASPDAGAEPVMTHEDARSLVMTALHDGAPEIVVQPILGLTTGRAVAYEALSRFHVGDYDMPPDQWFGLAHQAGLGANLEARAVGLAIDAGRERPSGTLLSVNVSPSVLSSRELHDVLPFNLDGLQFEITEKEVVVDPDHLEVVLDGLRGRGARIAIDDVGEGYAGLQRVMSIAPDLLKLDRSLVAGVDDEPAKAALIEAVVNYAVKIGSQVCAEGVETLEDLEALADLDVSEAQGWAVGYPADDFQPVTTDSQRTCERAFSRALISGGGHDPITGRMPLQQLLGYLTNISDLDELARSMSAVAETLACDRVELSYLDPSGAYLEAVLAEAWQGEGIRYYLDQYPLTKQALESHEIIRIVANDPDSPDIETVWMSTEGIRSLIGVPIIYTGQAIGFLECCQVDNIPWRRQQLRDARIVTTVLGPILGALHAQDVAVNS